MPLGHSHLSARCFRLNFAGSSKAGPKIPLSTLNIKEAVCHSLPNKGDSEQNTMFSFFPSQTFQETRQQKTHPETLGNRCVVVSCQNIGVDLVSGACAFGSAWNPPPRERHFEGPRSENLPSNQISYTYLEVKTMLCLKVSEI